MVEAAGVSAGKRKRDAEGPTKTTVNKASLPWNEILGGIQGDKGEPGAIVGQ